MVEYISLGTQVLFYVLLVYIIYRAILYVTTHKTALVRGGSIVNAVLKQMYDTWQVEDADGVAYKYNSGINEREGTILYKLAKQPDINALLEVGCAYGTSALYMCQGLKDKDTSDGTKHTGMLTSIDPFQDTQWHNVGINNIKKAGLSDYHTLMLMTSDRALPQLMDKKFDLIFIDGMHLFDYTLVDIFYSVKMLRIGGILLVDDVRHKGVAHVMRYIHSNYKMLRYEHVSDTMAKFVKTHEDDRIWSFHNRF